MTYPEIVPIVEMSDYLQFIRVYARGRVLSKLL